MNFFYPYHFKNQDNEHDIISALTTPDMDLFLKSNMTEFSSNIIIWLRHKNQSSDIYNDIIMRLCQNFIVVLIKIDDKFNIANKIKFNQFLMNVINTLTNTCMIKFRLNLTILQIIFIGHKSSCKFLLNITDNKIILIDPDCKPQISDNMSIIDFNDEPYNLSVIDPSMIFAYPTTDIKIMNSRVRHLTFLYDMINKIVNS